MTEPFDAEFLKDLRGLGKPPSFDGNDSEYQGFRISFRIHMSLASTVLSTCDGQIRSRTKSDLPTIRASAGRCTFEVLHTDVLLVGFDHERQCPNSCPFCCRILWSRGVACDTQQICSRHSKSTVRFDAEDHDACETLV